MAKTVMFVTRVAGNILTTLIGFSRKRVEDQSGTDSGKTVFYSTSWLHINSERRRDGESVSEVKVEPFSTDSQPRVVNGC